jgi:hypothetical protein
MLGSRRMSGWIAPPTRSLRVVRISHVVTVPELLDGHVVLDIECLDRVYLNGRVPSLQAAGQVITFLHDHLGMRIAP